MEIDNKNFSSKRKIFNERFDNLSESDIQKELLYKQQETIEKLEKIRSNTSTLIWFLLVIPVFIIIFFLFVS